MPSSITHRWSMIFGCLLVSVGFSQIWANETPEGEPTGVVAAESTVSSKESETAATKPLAALFVRNLAGDAMAAHLSRIEEMVLAEFAGKGFRVMSASDATRAVSRMAAQTVEERQAPDPVEEAINSNTNALRLAQNLESDFLLVVSVNSLSQETHEISMHDVQREVENTRLQLSYRMAHSGWGDQVLGGNVESTVTRSRSANYRATGTGHIDRLVQDAVKKLGAEYDRKSAELIASKPEILATTAREEVSFSIVCTVQDLSVPDIVLSQSGDYTVGSSTLEITPLDVAVELDGLVIGSAPGTFKARPGLHQLKLSREGFKPWQRPISVREGLELRVALVMTDEELARWRERTTFLQDLVTENKLVDAEVELVQGMAEMFSNSGYRIDSRSDVSVDQKVDVKVDATELPSQVVTTPGHSLWNSIFGNGVN